MPKSLLFVPAKEKMLTKIPSLSADVYIIDLEDSINEEEKNLALDILCDFLLSLDYTENIYIRLNKDRFIKEVNTLLCYNVGFMLPKFEKTVEYEELAQVWSQRHVIALIESPLGVVNLRDIVECEWVDALAFGAEDFTASMNMQNDDHCLTAVKTKLVTYAKAYNKNIYDTPSFEITEMDKFIKEVDNSVSLGFDGKLLISPKHIEYINNSFDKVNIEYLTFLISEYERRGEAVAVIDNKVYEKMHINRFRRIIKEHKTKKS